MKLTAQNTAIVLDSTADFPEAPERFPNWRVVPLYVHFGDESYRDCVELGAATSSTSGCARRPSSPTTSQPTPGDFLAVYEELAPSTSGSSRFRSPRRCPARSRAPHGGGGARRQGARRRHRDRVGRDRDARRSRSSAGSTAARATRRSTRSSSASSASRALLHRRHARVPAPRAAGSARARRWRARC